MQLKKVFIGVITDPLHTVHELRGARSKARHIVSINSLG